MKFLWDIELWEITEGTVAQEVTAYYTLQQKNAQRLLACMTPANFNTCLPLLTGIEERCSLLFYYLTNDFNDCFETTAAMVASVEQQYHQVHQERLEQIGPYDRASLLYVLNDRLDNYLWEVDFSTLLSQTLQLSPVMLRQTYWLLLDYFDSLAVEAKQLQLQLYADSFERVYPQLLTIDAKLRLLLNSVLFLPKCSSNQEEIIDIVETDYYLAHQELFTNEEWYDDWFLGNQLLRNQLHSIYT